VGDVGGTLRSSLYSLPHAAASCRLRDGGAPGIARDGIASYNTDDSWLGVRTALWHHGCAAVACRPHAPGVHGEGADGGLRRVARSARKRLGSAGAAHHPSRVSGNTALEE